MWTVAALPATGKIISVGLIISKIKSLTPIQVKKLMSLDYYFDGCSYTNGHCKESVTYAWPKVINPLTNPNDGHVNQVLQDKVYRKYSYIDHSCVARSNDAMYTCFITHLDEIIKNKTKVFIYFSHSERSIAGYDYSINKKYRALSSRFNYNKANPKDNIDTWIGGTIKTLSYIKSITHIAEANNIDVVIVTQDHYKWFEFVSNTDKSLNDCFNSIDRKYIFNWPAPNLINFSLFDSFPDHSYNEFLELWGCTGFTLQLAKGLSDNNSWVSKDLKHFIEDGHKWLAEALIKFSKDKTKNLAYYINELDLGKQRIFYDRNAWIESYFYGKETSHWIEDTLIEHFQSLINDIKTNKNFIYEE